LSVDPISGKVREVEVGLEVGFSVRAKDGKLLAPFQKMRWVQDYVFDESSLLGTYEQQSTIQGELSQDAAATILLRLETIEFAQPSS
jgi:outer membrane lipopolysaccharide assembly protein LptE/RlpB